MNKIYLYSLDNIIYHIIYINYYFYFYYYNVKKKKNIYIYIYRRKILGRMKEKKIK